jgi:GDP-4-dehydro-6-deoxy-D-mannose reductase
MRAFITGAGGFVGNLLWEALEKEGFEVAGCCLSQSGNSNRSLYPIDILDSAALSNVIVEFAPDVIYHLAAISFVPDCEKDFARAFAVNVCGTEEVVRAASLLRTAPRVVFISSGNVYGDLTLTTLPLTEDSPVCPTNTYSLTKVMAEEVIKKYDRTGAIHGVIFRPFNHIGPGQSDRFVVASFARQFAMMSLGKASRRLHVGNLTSYRDFTDVRDIVLAYVQGAFRGAGVYLLASGEVHSIQKIVYLLEQISGISPEIITEPDRQRDGTAEEIRPDVYPLRVEKELGWKPQVPLKQSIRDVFDYWISVEKEVA